jgi:sigma-E factor negative regulatory protein RseB
VTQSSPGLIRSTALTLAGVFCLAAADVSGQDAPVWIERMNKAVEQLNYRGTFVHMHGGIAETLHIVHGFDSGRVSERLLSMDGAGREIIRSGNEVKCIFPDKQMVLLEPTRELSPLASSLPSYSEELEPHYEFRLIKSVRVAQRMTQVIGITPRDRFRYGYRLWLDETTAMPLKTQMRDENDQLIEQILFTDFEILDEVPADALLATIDTQGFTEFQGSKHTSLPGPELKWEAAVVPPGFRLSAAKRSWLAGSEYPVDHLVYSDGLATVSVFIEDPKAKAEVHDGFSTVGSINAFSLTLDGRQVTAVGEVPRQTVQTIATSLTKH